MGREPGRPWVLRRASPAPYPRCCSVAALSSHPCCMLRELSAACQPAEPRGKGGVAAYVCAKVSPPREEVRLLGRSRRAGTNQRSVANSRGDAVAHVPRSGANGGVLCWGRGLKGGQGSSYTMAGGGRCPRSSFQPGSS